jgi:hypothetical protein
VPIDTSHFSNYTNASGMVQLMKAHCEGQCHWYISLLNSLGEEQQIGTHLKVVDLDIQP